VGGWTGGGEEGFIDGDTPAAGAKKARIDRVSMIEFPCGNGDVIGVAAQFQIELRLQEACVSQCITIGRGHVQNRTAAKFLT